MKFLDLPELDHLAASLSYSSPSIRLTTRIEAYSCKSVAREKKLFSRLDTELTGDLELSTSVSPPEGQGFKDSAFGPLDKKESRKTLWLLIATLNAAHPDHDFSRVKAEDFQREDSASAVLANFNDVVAHISEPANAYRSFASLSISPSISSPVMRAIDRRPVALDPSLRHVLDPIIDLGECEVYSYCPDLDSDPHAVDSDDEDFDDDSLTASIYGDDESSLGGAGPMWEMDELDLAAGAPVSGAVFSPVPRQNGGFHSQVSVPGTPAVVQPTQDGRTGWPPPPPPPAGLFPGGGAHTMGMAPAGAPPAAPLLLDATEDSDESAGGLLWSTYLLLYHRKKKRVLFLSAWCRKVSAGQPSAQAAQADAAPVGAHERDVWRFRQSLKRARSRAATPLTRRASNGSSASLVTPRKKLRRTRQASTPLLLRQHSAESLL